MNEINQQIRKNMEKKNTDELIEIWEEKNYDEWSPEAIDIVKQIILEREGSLPSPKPLFEKDEKVILDKDNITITSQKIIVKSNKIPIKAIQEIKSKTKRSGMRIIGGLVLIALSNNVAILIEKLFSQIFAFISTNSEGSMHPYFIIFAGVTSALFILGLFIFVRGILGDKFINVIYSNGETTIECKDKKKRESIINAINSAMKGINQ